MCAGKEKSSDDKKEVVVKNKSRSNRPVDVKELRERLGLTQKEFADKFKLSLSTIQNWEQGENNPRGAAELFLELIASDPEFVASTLAANPGK